jgi:hypothetical protein
VQPFDLALVLGRTALLSIDLIIRDPIRGVLVALRTNEPPKGSISFQAAGSSARLKPFNAAFVRILKAETGCRTEVDPVSWTPEHLC